MSPSFLDVAEEARTSWLANYTVGDEKWRLRQLHGLCNLVLNNRETIVTSLSSQQSVPKVVYEQEVAVFAKEISGHISRLNKGSANSLVKSLHWGKISVEERPQGVSLIVCSSSNLLRYALAPMAASIAANNVVILATVADQDSTLTLHLQQEWNKYLSPECLFFIPTIDLATVDASKVDHIAILDSSSVEYARILMHEHSHFYNIEEGHNVAIVDEGKKDWKNIAKQVSSNSSDHALRGDRLDAVFVRIEDVSDFQDALRDNWTAKKETVSLNGPAATGYVPWGNNTLYLDLKSVGNAENASLQAGLELVASTTALLVISVTSLDQALDLLSQLTNPIQQLALFAPGLKNNVAYVRKWAGANTLSVGSFRKVLRPVFDSFIPDSSTDAMFPTVLFSRSQMIAEEHFVGFPETTGEIQASYQNTIPPLKPEPRGERIGFFTQAEYFVKVVGATAVVLLGTASYFGAKVFRRRYLA